MRRGKTVLDALANCVLQKRSVPTSAVADLSSQFYELVPTYSRLVAPSIIDDIKRRNWFSEFVDFLMKIWDHASRLPVGSGKHKKRAGKKRSDSGWVKKRSMIGKSMELNPFCPAPVDEYCPVSITTLV